jgi:hypothetical protein
MVVELRKDQHEDVKKSRQRPFIDLADKPVKRSRFERDIVVGTGHDVHYMACESQDRAFPQTRPLETHGRRKTKTKRTRALNLTSQVQTPI